MTSDEEMPENEEHTPETDWLIGMIMLWLNEAGPTKYRW